MTPIVLLEQLKLFTETNTADLILPVKVKSGEPAQFRAAEVHQMRLPRMSDAEKKAPYLILQLVNGSDAQGDSGQQEGGCYIRIIACVYSEDESEGALYLLNIITRLRTELLKQRVIGGQFELQLPLEYVIYPDNTAPYFMGEMATNWSIPTIKREV